jgi:putative ABC transport system permease protein
MKPLTAFKYFWTNKKRGATVLIILFLSVAVVSFITSLVTSITIDATKANLDPLKNMSYITATSSEMFLKDDIVNKVKSIDEIKYIFNVSVSNTSLNTLIGNTSSPVLIPDKVEGIAKIMQEANLTLSSGRLPNESGFEIVLHERILQNKNLKVGDFIGNDVDENEWLNGKYKIVGELKGSSIVSFANKSTYVESLKNSGIILEKPRAQALFAKPGKIDEMNTKIERLSKKDVSYTTYSSTKRMYDEQLSSMNAILTIVIFVVVFIVSISISAMFYIVYLNRSEEFGILHAMGYRKSFIRTLILKELTALSIVSWIGGYIFSWGILTLVNIAFLNSKGQSLYFFTRMGLINTLIIPLMVIICSCVPLLSRLKKWDPISVIERRD